MDVGIGKITSDQFMLTGMYVLIKLRPINSCWQGCRNCENYERSIHVDRDVGIGKITTDLFMLTGKLVLIKLRPINSC